MSWIQLNSKGGKFFSHIKVFRGGFAEWNIQRLSSDEHEDFRPFQKWIKSFSARKLLRDRLKTSEMQFLQRLINLRFFLVNTALSSAVLSIRKFCGIIISRREPSFKYTYFDYETFEKTDANFIIFREMQQCCTSCKKIMNRMKFSSITWSNFAFTVHVWKLACYPLSVFRFKMIMKILTMFTPPCSASSRT